MQENIHKLKVIEKHRIKSRKEMNMKSEIISVGTELLLGNIINTNTAYLSEELAKLGIDVYFHVTVGDNREKGLPIPKTAMEGPTL